MQITNGAGFGGDFSNDHEAESRFYGGSVVVLLWPIKMNCTCSFQNDASDNSNMQILKMSKKGLECA